MLRNSLVVLLAVATLVAPSAAAADYPPASTVDALSVTRDGGTLTVQGAATFGDASAAVVGVDPATDAAYKGIGGELESAEIRHDEETLVFRLAIADPLPQVFTLPEFTHYHWQIVVTDEEGSTPYLLQAMRTGQYDRIVPWIDPLFRVNACTALASGSPSCFSHLAYVDGSMADGVVEWRVPRRVIGVQQGDTIAPGPNAIEVEGGASGAAYGTPLIDTMTPESYVVGPAVHVRARYASGITAAVRHASVGPDGTFVVKLPAVAGTATVTATACRGLATACGDRTVAVPPA